MKSTRNALIAACLLLTGCFDLAPPANPPPNATSASQQSMQTGMGLSLDPAGIGGATPPAPPQPASTPPAETPVTPTPPLAPPPATEQVKAEAGVGKKGQSLNEHSGVLVEPAKAYFRVEQKMVFNVEIPKALQLFEASEGRKPNSQDEFMTKVIGQNNIKLPTLPAGQKYVYNVEQGELMVERPAK